MDKTGDNNRFNCPIDGCIYGINGDKYFKRKLFLTQHIANKHSEKKYCCDKCTKKYAIEWQLKYHQKSCGLHWKCDSCPKSYTERLSLVMHCKRHSHNLPENALMKTSKSTINAPQINVQFLVLPIILDSNSLQQFTNQSNVGQIQRLVNILPKIDESNRWNESGTQTSVGEECNKCKIKANFDNKSKNIINFNSISTQTERLSQKSGKSGEQRSTECQTIRKRNRKTNNNYESIETQTLESALHLTESLTRRSCMKISASTSTSPPKKCKKRCLISYSNEDNNDLIVNNIQKLCAFTQTVGQLCTSTATTTEDSEVFVNTANPLLSQMDSTNHILEQSVQTEATEFSFDNEFINIETQTVNLDISSTDLLDFGATDEFLFSDLEFTDIETQTIWNNDRTTQTDEHLDQINDVFLRYLDNDSECEISDKTVFADTETQTQIDFPLLICSSAQTSQTFP